MAKKKEFGHTPDGEVIKVEKTEDTEACVMVPIPRNAEEVKGMFFVTKEEALNMAVTLILSAK